MLARLQIEPIFTVQETRVWIHVGTSDGSEVTNRNYFTMQETRV
jgi:hypothetical protein